MLKNMQPVNWWRKKLDMIACNDVSRADIGFASDENAMIVFFAEQYHMQKRDLEKASKQEIAQQAGRSDS